MGISIWNNPNIKIANVAIFYRRWHDKGINFIKDLLEENGRLLTYEKFQEKYNVQTNFIEFIGIKTSVELYIRRTEIDLGTEVSYNCYPKVLKYWDT